MMTLLKPPSFHLLGHRGARGESLENSKIGFAHAQLLHPKLNGVEFDVQLTQDHQLMVVHDAHLQRLANSQRLIYQSTLTELQGILQSDWAKFTSLKNTDFLHQPILALLDLLPYLQGYEHIELEVKTHHATDYQALAKALFKVLNNENWQTLKITITSFDTAFLTIWQNRFGSKLPFKTGLLLESHTKLVSEIPFFAQSRQEISAICNLACGLGCSQVGVHYGLITPELVQIAERFGLSVTAWTVNEVNVARQLIDWGVNTIITDFPSVFCQTLK